jgi:hypothetical protein
MRTIISEPDKSAILAKINDIPPIELRSALSPEGQALWENVKAEYEILHLELCAYFAGQETILSSLPDSIRQWLGFRRDQLLSFYELIRESWTYLKPHYGHDRKGNRLTPGLLLIATLDMEWRGKITPAVAGHCVVNPRKSYEIRTRTRNAKKLESSNPGLKQLEKDLSAQKQLEKDLSAHMGAFKQFALLEVAILSHCRAAAKNDEFVRRKLNDFDRYSQDLEKFIYKEFDFRKAKTQIWEKGQKQQRS